MSGLGFVVFFFFLVFNESSICALSSCVHEGSHGFLWTHDHSSSVIAWLLCMPGGNSELALTHVEACGRMWRQAVLSGLIHRVPADLSSLAFSHYD